MFGDVNQIEASGNVSSVPAFPPAFSGDKISSAFSQRFWDIAARLTFAADDAPPQQDVRKVTLYSDGPWVQVGIPRHAADLVR
jgi:hypothetical protein